MNVLTATDAVKEKMHMTTFTIDSANHITAWATEKEAAHAEAAARFTSAEELQRLGAGWPLSRLIEIWNHIPGFRPVQKFTDRKTAITRIWKAAQSLAGNHGSASPQVEANKPALSGKSRSRRAASAKQAARPAQYGRQPADARQGSKKAEILALLQQPQGATLQDLMAATRWQAHSVRGFISAVSKKMGLTVQSTKRDDGERVYQLAR